ncbi:MAG: O-antigen polymerase [Pseudomonadota bacterium]
MIITALIVQFAILYVSRVLGDNIFSISRFFILCWTIYLSLAIFFGYAFDLRVSGIVWIVFANLLWLAGCLLARKSAVSADAEPFDVKRLSISNVTIVVLCGLGLMGTFFDVSHLYEEGLGFEEIGRERAAERYRRDGGQSLLANAFYAFAYFACIAGGLRSRIDPSLRNLFWTLVPVLTFMVVGLLNNSKASVLYALTLWLGGHLTARRFMGQEAPTVKNLIAIGVGGIGLIYLFGYMQAARYSFWLSNEDIADVLAVYAFGYLAGFSIWFEEFYPGYREFFLGARSFGSVAGYLPLPEHFTSFHRDIIPIHHHYTTTIVTFFAELILDFGRWGALVVVFLSGFFARMMDNAVLSQTGLAFGFSSMLYALIVFSPITSLLNYTTIFLAFVLFQIYFVIRMRSDQ